MTRPIARLALTLGLMVALTKNVSAFTLYHAGGFLGYTYNKWGGPTVGQGATVTWGLMPAGTSGSSYCGEACPGTSKDQIRIWSPSANAFVWTPLSNLIPAFERALRNWSKMADVRFVGPNADTGLPINHPAATPPATAEIRIGAFDFVGNAQFFGAVGYAPPPNGGTGEGDILFNSANFFQLVQGPEGTSFDLFPPGGGPFMNEVEGLFLHEVGHALGLDHPNNVPPELCPVMSVHPNCFGRINHIPDRDDILGVRTLYSFNPDLNADRVINCGDLDALTSGIVLGSSDPQLDLNGDGVLNGSDRMAWLASAGAALLPSGNPFPAADANLDGTVNGADFDIWFANRFTNSSSFCRGDFNSDGAIEGADFGIWNVTRSVAVPEPSGWMVVLLFLPWNSWTARSRIPRQAR